ncbi:MAG TPA: FTR1 family protein [Acidimicrobiales bacterium]|nr:FTR1 family protein [Acidimicrobiales bacterium]
MIPSLLIMLREGFEAALVVSIVFAYLRRIGRLDLGRSAWSGVAAAVGVSVAVGVVIHLTLGELGGVARWRAFAAVSLLATAVLTWMIFWMRRQSRAIKGELERGIDSALAGGGHGVRRAIFGVAFLAVVREGIEAALFLLAAATSDGGGQVVLGAAVGIAMAAVLGYTVYAGGRRLPMKAFFTATGVIIIVFAAGLVARTVLFLQAGGDLGTLADSVYDLTSYGWLTQSTEMGRFLAAMFGWDPRPSLEQVVAYLAYLVPVTWLFLHRPRGAQAPSPAVVAVPADDAGSEGATAGTHRAHARA